MLVDNASGMVGEMHLGSAVAFFRVHQRGFGHPKTLKP